jgi:hypothetical protein
MRFKLLLPAILVFAIADAAMAQSGRLTIEGISPSGQRQEGQVRVQMSIQLFLVGPTDESEEADKQRERARKALYRIAGAECDLLREVVARDCRLESITVNLSRQGSSQMPGYSVSGSMGFQISLK